MRRAVSDLADRLSRSRSTTTTRSGAPSTTATGRAHYFIDANGQIRGHHFGEGEYDESERLIRRLLQDAGRQNLPPPVSAVAADGVQSAADNDNIASPETYVGYGRAENFASPGGFAHDVPKVYALPSDIAAQPVGARGPLDRESGKRSARCGGRPDQLPVPRARPASRAGAGKAGKPIRFRVTLDGQAPGTDGGVDIDANGEGVIREQRLYQLIRQSDGVRDRTFTIEFLDAGAEAFAFTFG